MVCFFAFCLMFSCLMFNPVSVCLELFKCLGGQRLSFYNQKLLRSGNVWKMTRQALSQT